MKNADNQVFTRAIAQATLGLRGRHNFNAWNFSCDRAGSQEELDRMRAEKMKLVQDGYMAAISDVLTMLSNVGGKLGS